MLDEKLFLVQFKVQKTDHTYRSVTDVQIADNKSLEDLLSFFKEAWSNKDKMTYTNHEMIKIEFEYRFVLDPEALSSKLVVSRNRAGTDVLKKATFNFGGYNLPSTMDLHSWGEVEYSLDKLTAVVYKANSKAIYYITIDPISLNSHTVELRTGHRLLLSFKDVLNDPNNLGTFTRTFQKQEYTFVNGELLLKRILRKTKYLSSIKQTMFLTHKFITMDLETKTEFINVGPGRIEETLIPYAVSIYDGSSFKSFYRTEYEDSDKMLEASVIYLMKRSYNLHRVYLHNFSKFDGIFLVRVLSRLSNNIDPIIRDGRIIDLRFGFVSGDGKSKYFLYFRDSYLLLPDSLGRLATNFSVNNKGLFPYAFVNQPGVSLDYVGPVPGPETFGKISREEYLIYSKEFTDKS